MLFISFLFLSIPACAQDSEEPTESAEINAFINNKPIPSIKVTDWTSINITVEDASGIPWGSLKTKFPILSVYVWPFIHPTWRPYLGYTKLQFETEVIEGDGRGWYHKVTPNGIPEADRGRIYELNLEVKTDDIAVDYSVVIGIKATRISAQGVIMGSSYINVPVKASSLNNVKMYTRITTKTTPPRSMINYNVDLVNDGYYRDTFKVEVEGENGLIVHADKQALVLEPNETKAIEISVLTPEKFFDTGTPNRLNIYVSSISDPKLVKVGELIVISEGFYISPVLLTVIIFLSIFLLLLIQSIKFINKRRKTNEAEAEKNKKPKKKFEKSLENLFSNIRKTSKEQDKIEEKKSESEPIKKEKNVLITKINREKEEDRIKKEKALSKIRKQQKKQRR
jgi:hypothetical protein